MRIDGIAINRNSIKSKSNKVAVNNEWLFNIGRGSVVKNLTINSDVVSNIHIGQFCTIKNNVTFRLRSENMESFITTSNDQHVALLAGIVLERMHVKGHIIIQNDVYIGENTTISGGVIIRNGAVIDPNSYVTEDVPAYAVVGGNPARVLRYRFNNDQINSLQNIAWWEWNEDKFEECSQDFALPVEEFIEKYSDFVYDNTEHTMKSEGYIMLFPDFGIKNPLWKRTLNEYCIKSRNDKKIGKLVIGVLLDNCTANNLDELQAFYAEYDDQPGEIEILTGTESELAELMKSAGYYVLTKEERAVYHSCLADLYGVRILSGVDMPEIFDFT